jgi:glutathione S-transferase
MKLYNANLSPNAFRVRVVAEELGIELEIIEVDFRKGEHKSASYLAINPNGKVPVLVDGDFVLWESRAINAYLAGLRPERGLYPADPKQRATVDQWSYWQAVHLGPAMQRVVFERYLKPKFGMGETDETAVESQLKELAQFLPVLEANLAGKEWVAGDLSLADFAMGSTFIYRKPAGIPLDEVPNIAAWMTRIESRPSWQAAVAPVLSAIGD